MIREISVIIIYCIWVMNFHLQNVKRIEKLEDKNRELEKRINDLEKTVYIVPRD